MTSIKNKLACIFSNLFSNKFKFVEEVDTWYYLDEVTNIWKKDTGMLLLDIVQAKFPKELYIEFENQYQQIEELFILDVLYEREKINKMILWLKSRRNIESLISELKLNYYTSNLTIFNSNPMNLLFKNEIMLDLKTKTVEQINPEHLISDIQKMDVNYEEAIKQEKMIVIEKIFESIVDKDKKQLLIKVLYESLIGINPRKIMICYGSSSTKFLELFLSIVGTYGITFNGKLLNDEFMERYLFKMKSSRVVLFKGVSIEDVEPTMIKELASPCNEFSFRRLYESRNYISLREQSFFINVDQDCGEIYENNEALKYRIIKIKFKKRIEEIHSIVNFREEYGMQLIHFILNNYK